MYVCIHTHTHTYTYTYTYEIKSKKEKRGTNLLGYMLCAPKLPSPQASVVEVEGALSTPPHLKIQATKLDAVKSYKSLLNT